MTIDGQTFRDVPYGRTKRDDQSGRLSTSEYLSEYARFDLSCPRCGDFLFAVRLRRGYKDGLPRQSYICLSHHETVNPVREV